MTSHMPGGKPGSVVKARTTARGRGKPRHERQTKVIFSDHTMAIIGTGNIGSTLAANFAAGGQDFLLADRNQDRARKMPPTSAALTRSAWVAWTSPSASRCSATCTNTVPWAGS